MKLNIQSKRTEYLYRHFLSFFPHLTLLKTLNLLLNIIEMKYNSSTPLSLPPYIKVEPTPVCQLKCPHCKSNKMLSKNDMHLSLSQFKKIINPIRHTLLGISLSGTGEPMLNKNIVSFIEYAHSMNIAVHLPSNLSMRLDDNKIDDIIRSGLDTIEVSLDGASEESYTKYRVGGSFPLVLNNVRALSEAKQRLRKKRPRIIWKFIVFEHNKHEVQTVKEKFSSLGFDNYEFMLDVLNNTAIQTKKAHN